MIDPADWILKLEACQDKALAGMKAVNLGRLIRAGFPVPGGFVVTTVAFRAPVEQRQELEQAICQTYRAIGSPSVAVRSSATAEDMAGASMAGQYDTFLDIVNEEQLLEAVRKCWASIDSPRTRSYFQEHGIELHQVAMAVVVQKLVAADVAGVMFTANPQSGGRREMLIEASWGLGEAVVSGRVQPDLLRVDRQTGRVLSARIADKQIQITPGAHEERCVEEHRRRSACLNSVDVTRLWRLGCKAAEHFHGEQDLEWAISGGEPYLLQSRPITTLEEAEAVEHVMQETRAELRGELAAGHGPWVVHNLGETLPHPTPLTWSVMRRLMSGAGGFGNMYRAAGFEPSAKAASEGFLRRIAGRVYMDLSRAPEMFFADYPFAYDATLLRDNPDAANAPPTVPSGSARQRLSAMRRVGAAGAKLRTMAIDLHQQLRDRTIPEFVAWCTQEKQRLLGALSTGELIDLWRSRQQRVLDDFAPQSLLPSLISGMAMLELQQFLAEHFWNDDPRQLAELLASAREPDKTLLANMALYQVSQDARSLESWIEEFGHRAPDELDLATPRWSERPSDLLPLARLLRDGVDPAEKHRSHHQLVEAREQELRSKLAPAAARELDQHLLLARQYLVYREDGKYYLTLGYALLRDVAMEMGRRLEASDGIFHLTEEELIDALHVGFAPLHLIEQRKLAYQAESRVQLPQVVDDEGLSQLGEPPAPLPASGAHAAYALSPGRASGPVRIVRSPQEAGDLGRGYVLVCTSTDPAWTPLFVNAAALVLECGGTLSHGAVVAREMGIAAVVLPRATTILTEGQTITVDGHRGAVAVGDIEPTLSCAAPTTSIEPTDVPPPPGRRELIGRRVALGGLIFWSIFLAAAFLLPADILYQPSIRVLDAVLWPIVQKLGRAGAVALIAATMAAITMLAQRLMTDNARLLEAKQRAARLRARALLLPKDAQARATMQSLAAPVQMRILVAALVPLAIALGPMVMIFGWFPARVDPASWNAPAGSTVSVLASVDGDYPGSLSLHPTSALQLDAMTPAQVTVPPIRQTLEKLRERWRRFDGPATQPWELQQRLADTGRAQQLAALDDYLAHPIPPQTIVWKLRTDGSSPIKDVVQVHADRQTAAIPIALGEQYPPAVSEKAMTTGPVRSIKVLYENPPVKRTFWAPFRHFKVAWDAGWLLTYLAAYLPAMYLCRRQLRIA